MPVIRVQRAELEKLGVSVSTLEENVRMLGADLKSVGEEILVEFFPDRPDLYTVEGIARALKTYTGKEEPKEYRAVRGTTKLKVEPDVKEVRPYIVAAVIRNIDIDDSLIKSMMDFQEKLHITVGRKRKKVAIGLHDFDKIKPPFTYTTRSPDFEFVPLGFEEKMSLREILEKHPKGVEYGHIIENASKYPIILDAEGNVLSFPPIINGTLTQITTRTKNIFVDITGTDLETLKKTLNIVTCAFADRGATVETVQVSYPEFTLHTPEMEYQEMSLELKYAGELTGVDVDAKTATSALKRMGYLVETEDGKITVRVQPYRMDVLHPVDVVEDIVKGIGYDNLPRKRISRYHRGRGHDWEHRARISMLGLGFVEIKTLTLVSFEEEYDKMRIPRNTEIVVENPVTEMTETLRTWLIPSLMATLRNNRHRDLPQRIFEVGYVRTNALERHLAFLVEDSKTGFTDAKSLVERVLSDLGVKNFAVEPAEHGSFIPGRCASIIIDGAEAGVFGEIHPEVLENFELGYPVIGAEINMEKILRE